MPKTKLLASVNTPAPSGPLALACSSICALSFLKAEIADLKQRKNKVYYVPSKPASSQATSAASEVPLFPNPDHEPKKG